MIKYVASRSMIGKIESRGGGSTVRSTIIGSTLGSTVSEVADRANRADGADRASGSEEHRASISNTAPLARMALVAAQVAAQVANARPPVRRIESAPQLGLHGVGQYGVQYLKATKKRGKLAQRIQRGYVFLHD